jgi:hypothetical protein
MKCQTKQSLQKLFKVLRGGSSPLVLSTKVNRSWEFSLFFSFFVFFLFGPSLKVGFAFRPGDDGRNEGSKQGRAAGAGGAGAAGSGAGPGVGARGSHWGVFSRLD